MSNSSSDSGTIGARVSTGDLASARSSSEAVGPATGAGVDASRGREDGRGGQLGLAIVGVALLALLAVAIATIATREGPGLTPDSRGYLVVAEQVSLGHGLKMLDGDGK